MLRRLVPCALLSLVLAACGDDDETGSTTTVGSSGGETSTTTADSSSSTSTGTSSSSTTDPSTSTSTTDPSTTEPDTSGTTDPSTGGSTGGPLICDETATGDWAACRDGDGINVGLCGWAPGNTTGTANCLTTSANPDASVCMIEGCEDACDCFAEPATGNANVICAEYGNGDTKGCALGCAGGQTCPNGMDCLGGVCYHVP